MQAFKKYFVPAIATAVLCLAASAAQADTYDLKLVGGSYSAHWQMDSSPVLAEGTYSEGKLWLLESVQGDFNGNTQSFVVFLNKGYLGGVMIGSDMSGASYDALAYGQQVYTGSESAPTLKLGTFTLADADGGPNYTLTISNVTAVPEPESYLLMLAGLGVTGLVIARRRKA